MKTQLAYKVVSADSGGVLASAVRAQDSVQYVPNQWTRPMPKAPNKFLFVFKTRAAARRFLKENAFYRKQMWRCEVENPTETRQGWTTMGRPFDANFMAGNKTYWPEGTLFVDAVKLLYKTH